MRAKEPSSDLSDSLWKGNSRKFAVASSVALPAETASAVEGLAPIGLTPPNFATVGARKRYKPLRLAHANYPSILGEAQGVVTRQKGGAGSRRRGDASGVAPGSRCRPSGCHPAGPLPGGGLPGSGGGVEVVVRRIRGWLFETLKEQLLPREAPYP